jgi:hypothetical protein
VPEIVPPTEPHPYRPLSSDARRAVASAALRSVAHASPIVCATLIDALDAVSWGVLALSGLAPAEARGLLALLWAADPTRATVQP